MKLYLMRHGETFWNKEQRLQGCSDIELNEWGISLAQEVGEQLKAVDFHRAFTSPLIRAKQTAACVLGDRPVPLVEDERIREISFGEWEGLSFSAPDSKLPREEFAKFFEKPADYEPPKGGETVEQLYTRTGSFVRELLNNAEYEEENILVTAHGAAVRAMMYNLVPVTMDQFWRGTVPPNCSLNIFDIDDKKVRAHQCDVTLYQTK